MAIEIKIPDRLPSPDLRLQHIVVEDGINTVLTIHLDFVIVNAQLADERKRMIQTIQDIVYEGSFEIVPYTQKGTEVHNG